MSSPAASPSPSSIASPPAYAWPRTLAAGSYATSFIWSEELVFHFTVPDGWESRDVNIVKGGRMSVQFYLVENVVIDPCAPALQDPPIEPGVEELATALSELVTLDAGPTEIQVGGRGGTYLEFTVGPDFGCAPEDFRLMKLQPGVCREGCGGLGPPWKGLEFGGAEEHNRLWIIGVGQRGHVVINAVSTPEATEADLAELQAVIDSARLETPNATPPPQAQPTGS